MVRMISATTRWLREIAHPSGLDPHIARHHRRAIRKGMARGSLLLVGVYFIGATFVAGNVIFLGVEVWHHFCHACGAAGELMGGFAAIMEEEETAVV